MRTASLDTVEYSPMNSKNPPLYTIWPGKNSPCCNGMCLCTLDVSHLLSWSRVSFDPFIDCIHMCFLVCVWRNRCAGGPHYNVIFITFLLIGGHAFLFSYYVALKIHWAVIVCFLPFVAASFWSLLATTWSDPGIIPRGTPRT
jgi:hypothetical protein